MTFHEYQKAVEALPYGKRLPTARYVYTDAETPLPQPLSELVHRVRQRFASDGQHNLIKLHTESLKISLLHYPRFFEDPHPGLSEAVIVDLEAGQAKRLSYSGKDNPPILHRKETMLPPGHPKQDEFAALSSAEEKHGLYRDTSRIGFKQNWEKLLKERGLSYKGHQLISSGTFCTGPAADKAITVHRHRTAMTRTELSKPVREILSAGLLRAGQTFFDYGCGLGSDVRLLGEMNFQSAGWDPVHAPAGRRQEAEVVNLGFVLNVIEDPAERVDTLLEAWALTQKLLVVSTLVEGQESGHGFKRNLNDGIVTVRNTFQKYFAQAELQLFIEETLHADADAIGLGIFVVFRDPQARQTFLFSRIERDLRSASVHQRILRPSSVRKPRPGFDEVYTRHQSLLDAFWLRFVALGRLPLTTEFDQLDELTQNLGRPSRIARLLLNHFGDEALEEARLHRSDDLLVYLALAQFRRAVSLRQLPEALQRDIKTFCGSYKEGQQKARALLYSAGQPPVITEACEKQTFGWNTVDHYTFHRSLLDQLPPVLRVYVHCSSIIYGNPRDADLIKIHKHSGKVTLQFYQDFDGQMLPALNLRVKVNLRSLRAQIFDHSQPPYRQIMPFKERFLGPGHPGLADIQKFSRRVRQLGLTPEAAENGISPEVMVAALRRHKQS